MNAEKTLLLVLHQNALAPCHAMAHARLYSIHQLPYSLPYSDLHQRDFPERAFSEVLCGARPVPLLNLQCMFKVPLILRYYGYFLAKCIVDICLPQKIETLCLILCHSPSSK